MRNISVSAEVFAAIWAQRKHGEASEDAILGRILLGLNDSRSSRSLAPKKNAAPAKCGSKNTTCACRQASGYSGPTEENSTRRPSTTATGFCRTTAGPTSPCTDCSWAVVRRGENAWKYWNYSDEKGRISSISRLRRRDLIRKKAGIDGSASSCFEPRSVAQRTSIALRSLTLVPVGPGTNRSPTALNAVQALLPASIALASTPAARMRATVEPSAKAPALSSEPSMPSVSAASAWMPAMPSMPMREGQQELAVAPALALRPQRHGGLAARQDQHRLPERPVAQRDLAGDRGMDAADLARLALDGIGQDDRLDALAPGFGCRRFERHRRPRRSDAPRCGQNADRPVAAHRLQANCRCAITAAGSFMP